MINPYQTYSGYPNYPTTPNIYAPLPQQQVTRVRGRESAQAVNLAPNSSILLLDETAPLVWLCTSDGVGRVTAEAYDISPHKDAPPVDMVSVEARLSRLEELVNARQSDVRKTKPKQHEPELGED